MEYSELPSILARDVEGKFFAERTKKCKILGKLIDREMKKLKDRCCSEFQDIFESKAHEEMRTCLKYQIKTKTALHLAERKTNMFGY